MSNEDKNLRDGDVAAPTETVIPDWALHRAAQIWCEPEHSSKVMDPDMAKSFARALAEQRERGAKVLRVARDEIADGIQARFEHMGKGYLAKEHIESSETLKAIDEVLK